MNRVIAVIAATAATTTLFFAVSPARAQERNAIFAGPRLEATIGYDTTRLGNQRAGAPESIGQVRLGVAAGYDVALGDRVTLGGEIGYGQTLGDGRRFRIGTSQLDLDQGHELDAALRLGYRAGDRTLVYGKAGWANSRYVSRIRTGASTIRAASNEDGVRLGAGVEQMLGDSVYAKAEYRFTTYGDDVTRHQLLAGVGVRF